MNTSRNVFRAALLCLVAMGIGARGYAQIASIQLNSLDVGSVPVAGTTTVGNGFYDLVGSGTGIEGSRDQFQYANELISGDSSVNLQVIDQAGAGETGLMYRAGLTNDAPFIAITHQYGFGTAVTVRGIEGQPAEIVAYDDTLDLDSSIILSIRRQGNTFYALESDPSFGGSQILGTVTVEASQFPSQLNVGIVQTSDNEWSSTTSIVEGYMVGPFDGSTSYDIGNPATFGSTNYDGQLFTLKTESAGFSGRTDQFQYHFVVPQNVTYYAYVSSLQGGPGSQAGLTLRTSLNLNSPSVSVVVDNTNGVVLYTRSTISAQSVETLLTPGVKAPYWVELQREGTSIKVSSSPDGVNWSTPTSVSLPISASQYVLAGLSATSQNASSMTTAVVNQIIDWQ